MRCLNLILGDQLDRDSAVFDDLDADKDGIWMAEVPEETSKVGSHKVRTLYFLSAMRHFCVELKQKGYAVTYSTLKENADTPNFHAALKRDLERLRPETVRVVLPGEYAVLQTLKQTVSAFGRSLEILPDRHFICDPDEFRAHAHGRKQLRMEYFYRDMRKKTALLIEDDGKPSGGKWNYDAANRKAFPASGPPEIPTAIRFPPDEITREVRDEVEDIFPDNVGDTRTFDWPVTPEQALEALDDFIAHRLMLFGDYQDAMWAGKAFLFHTRLSCALNVKLIDPLTVCRKIEQTWRAHPGKIPLEAAEGLIRQILGWREYVRGIYWMHMPEYLEGNALEALQPLPSFYWSGDTRMACMQDALRQTLKFGYAHHIQRLMVTGLYALLLGVNPKDVHEWYLAVYLDAVEWVELPNTLGMSQYGDGGRMASKPYVASGKYIDRMSNYCGNCPFDPGKRTGKDACPFTVLYWDFLERHAEKFQSHPRMKLQVRNLDRIPDNERAKIRMAANVLRNNQGAPAS